MLRHARHFEGYVVVGTCSTVRVQDEETGQRGLKNEDVVEMALANSKFQ